MEEIARFLEVNTNSGVCAGFQLGGVGRAMRKNRILAESNISEKNLAVYSKQ